MLYQNYLKAFIVNLCTKYRQYCTLDRGIQTGQHRILLTIPPLFLTQASMTQLTESDQAILANPLKKTLSTIGG